MLNHMNLRHTRGFTMVELAIAIAILGLLFAFAAPSVSTMIRNTQIRNAAESIQNGLQLARTAALRQNRNVSFWLVSSTDPKNLDSSCTTSATGPSWMVSVNDPTGKCDITVSDSTDPMTVDKHAAGEGSLNTVLTSQPTSGADRVTFNGLGQRISGSNQYTQINIALNNASSDDRPMRIEIGTGGLIRMCDPSVTASTDSRRCLY
ncbi:type IV fimbrial biogenesis protein FimT [Andreprevotia lacus DSM 23236]|jgi:type IV fimbrial biogenesis protein FimT|uniref:Type II secretion system protein H n=1 Tax=Andreprevotia lacus DSM 23236 TaxID=1121001 RepID=A0A1W1XB99_9NEIS|nr:GspH/FimT family pseudopilin [Andreprevotia lacus]SMC21123.1 type IV fimbrial biogenesis protein FimT [Andreprevotia lacus DSM 23236]